MLRNCLAAGCVALGLWAQQAGAIVLLDTTAGVTPNDNYFVTNTAGTGQSIAVPFTVASEVEITSITTFISADLSNVSVDVGILADVSGLPSSGAFLDFTTLVGPFSSPQTLSVSWLLGPGIYWLAAIGQDGFSGKWQSGAATGDFAFTVINGPVNDWTAEPSGRLPAALIEAVATPEPAAGALLAAGLLGLATTRRRRVD